MDSRCCAIILDCHRIAHRSPLITSTLSPKATLSCDSDAGIVNFFMIVRTMLPPSADGADGVGSCRTSVSTAGEGMLFCVPAVISDSIRAE